MFAVTVRAESASHRGGSGSVPGHFMWICSGEIDIGLLPVLSFPRPIVSPPNAQFSLLYH
jgi:hypothetical protein